MNDIKAALARLSKEAKKPSENDTAASEQDVPQTGGDNVHPLNAGEGNASEKTSKPKGARLVQSWLKAAVNRFEDAEAEALGGENLPAQVEKPALPMEAESRPEGPVLPKPMDLKAMVLKEERRGFVALAAFMIFIVAWSTLAPLSSAAIAPGVISPLGSRKTVQHLEGGIIERILVAEGAEVEAGDPLVLLEDTMARASYELIATQYYTRAAQQARLLALQTGAEFVTFPTWLLEKARDPKTFEILDTQRQLLVTQRRAHADSKAVLSKKIEQLGEEVKGLEAQIEGQTRQLELINKEISGVQKLVSKGLERTPRLLALQRTEAEINAARGANQAAISRTLQAIGETELQLIAADTSLQNKVAEELSAVQTELAAAGERMAASEDILNRIQISAPVSGRVVDLKVHTSGGVIGPGQAIMDIVPEHEDLVIEARVSPLDIDVVSTGLEAQVHLSAFAQRNLPQIKGTVTNISADRLVDDATGQAYFRATVAIDRESLAELGDEISLSPGMPAEVMIVTGEQTLLGYLIGPLKKTLTHAFREG